MEDFKFKVDLKGIIRLLSDNLYSNDSVFLRELLQNGVDAISAQRLALGESPFTDPQISITYTDDPSKETAIFTMADNGIGLTTDEIHEFLSIIGHSSKRDAPKAANTYIGQFGIGLLSCFLVTDLIDVHTKSETGGETLRWLGRSDGTYEIRTDGERTQRGTEVRLTLRGEKRERFSERILCEKLSQFGYLLRMPILFTGTEGQRILNDNIVPWREDFFTTGQVLEFGEAFFHKRFLDAIPLADSELEGYAYILPYQSSSSARPAHRIFLKDMYITDEGKDLVPEWAFFLQCVINVKNLTPLASREGFYNDAKLRRVRSRIEKAIITYLSTLASYDPNRLETIIDIHSLALKALAVDNEKVFRLFFPFFKFSTTAGRVSGRHLIALSKRTTVLYTETVDNFRQMSPVMEERGHVLINAGYTYDSTLLSQLTRLQKETNIKLLGDHELLRMLKNPTSTEAKALQEVEEIADNALDSYRCRVEFKRFQPAELACLYVRNEDAQLWNDIDNAKESFDDEFSAFLDDFEGYEEIYTGDHTSKLYLNLDNPMIERVTDIADDEVLEMMIQVLYVQSLLLGHYPLNNADMTLLNKNLTKLIELGLNG